MKLTFLDKLGIGLLALGLSAILGPPTISFFKDRLQNNFHHITCYGENNKPIANFGVNWTGVNVGKDLAEAWIKILVPIHELKAEGLIVGDSSYGTFVAVQWLNSAESNRIDEINTINLTEYRSLSIPMSIRPGEGDSRVAVDWDSLTPKEKRRFFHSSNEQKRSRSFARQDLKKDRGLNYLIAEVMAYDYNLGFSGIDASLQKHRGTEGLSDWRKKNPENVWLRIGELPYYYSLGGPDGPRKKESGNYGAYIEFVNKRNNELSTPLELETSGKIFFKNCRYSPRFFKNTDLIVPYDAEQI